MDRHIITVVSKGLIFWKLLRYICVYIFHSANRKYRNKDNKNKWSTTDSKQRSVWYYTLTNEKMLENYVTWLNEIECPQCKQVVDKNSSKFAPDRYYYCYKCYDELASQYKFKTN